MASVGEQREAWGSRIGLILAAAGNAIGIGNLLRFPGQAAQSGGGAFMVPYVVCLLLFGLPMMWVAWTIGRYGGRFGHGTTPGMFDRLWRAPLAKYLGALGVALPLIFCLYYTYIEAWCLGYSYFSLTGDYANDAGRTVDLVVYLQEFLGDSPTHSYFSGLSVALVFVVITVAINVFILYRGVAKGIEILAKVAMPLLLLFCLILAVRVFTTTGGKGSAWEGLSFLWTPDFSGLSSPKVWVAAAGQIFFTLSIGIGSLECYASYLRANDDIALTGLTTASTNEFVEIVFGSLIAIPAAALFYGGDAATLEGIASKGTFYLGMISMPEVLRSMPGVEFFGTIWFLLLFLAAFTSSVAVCQPLMAFLEDEAKLKRGTAATLVGLIWLLGSLPVVFFLRYGVLDEMDFWAGKIGLVVFSAIEVVLFAWIFGLWKGWEELHRGADIRVPRIFYPITLIVTPICLILLLGWWFNDAIAKNTLIPTPKLSHAVVERVQYPGDFSPPPVEPAPADEELSEERRLALEKEAGDLGKELKALSEEMKGVAEHHGRDLKAWAKVSIDADGATLAVDSVEGDPTLMSILDPAKVARYLTLSGFGYHSTNGQRDGPFTVTVAIEVLYTAPYIWLTRVLIIAITLTIMGCIRTIWKARADAVGESEEEA